MVEAKNPNYISLIASKRLVAGFGRRCTHMGTATRPATTSPAPWDAFSDVEAFVDEVVTELAAMAADGTRPTRPGPKPALAQAGAGRGGAAQSDHGDLVHRLLRHAVAGHEP